MSKKIYFLDDPDGPVKVRATRSRVTASRDGRVITWIRRGRNERSRIERRVGIRLQQRRAAPPVRRISEVFRSMWAVVYAGSSVVEFRVWVHTSTPRITEGILMGKVDDLIRFYTIAKLPPGAFAQMDTGTELNEPIGQDEVMPPGSIVAEFPEAADWYGFCQIHFFEEAKGTGIRTRALRRPVQRFFRSTGDAGNWEMSDPFPLPFSPGGEI